MFKITGLTILIACILFVGCSAQQSNIYEKLNQSYTNILPVYGTRSEYTPTDGFINLEVMESELNTESEIIFKESVSWYATESDFPFTKLNNKTAKEIVDIVNCLKKKKQSNTKERSVCFFKKTHNIFK
ncbi:hypothetical protein JQC92_20435 [Shewanella sp. 202IG2-18]|uniref:hypothetical protein n=1 Tax=Parashewanella hymeniacidonis TaxID=2807618 RepID=UPI0019618250|nr:hypothetical protein [Parashewanella hymeniacidonis]MBM7074362.1 hypothetical protein [Parashewanella hymeniacidonis]